MLIIMHRKLPCGAVLYYAWCTMPIPPKTAVSEYTVQSTRIMLCSFSAFSSVSCFFHGLVTGKLQLEHHSSIYLEATFGQVSFLMNDDNISLLFWLITNDIGLARKILLSYVTIQPSSITCLWCVLYMQAYFNLNYTAKLLFSALWLHGDYHTWRCSHCYLVPSAVTTGQWLHRLTQHWVSTTLGPM